jgi:hypothetical protein
MTFPDTDFLYIMSIRPDALKCARDKDALKR